MGFFSKLFGFSKQETKTADVEPIDYDGYLIYPEPKAEGGQFRIAGRICKDFGDDVKTHVFVRSDLLSSKADAESFMINKAKMFIDQTGDKMFG
ncbi:HlyU family transcriptional regulator [Photobacterium lutimaris]|uniref:Transcriptional regulator n=1 Tax=Photobacterium lutimaris TaxID=388278 RepID=A0A2T3J5C1_9GAMM|nr:HlyU family transcriptional regulator [Photobacterium lutimaris]PSU36488.1 transcriptional regulator [Photobacterium lutimaris]TDR79140.1 hypothetical protein DFP78_101656 [Photobacterium lutimaris]